ncbi:unnamed protein product [Trichobilharzia regenti]|nr:unnamed protein product [Trichobilharzia regenti]
MYCFQMAYATGRTLLLSTSGYSDTYTKWWIDNFLPLSDKCTVNDIQSKIIYNCKFLALNASCLSSSLILIVFSFFFKNIYIDV